MEERLRALKYSREMNEKSTTAQPQETSSESNDFDDDSDDDFLELDDEDTDDNVRKVIINYSLCISICLLHMFKKYEFIY